MYDHIVDRKSPQTGVYWNILEYIEVSSVAASAIGVASGIGVGRSMELAVPTGVGAELLVSPLAHTYYSWSRLVALCFIAWRSFAIKVTGLSFFSFL